MYPLLAVAKQRRADSAANDKEGICYGKESFY
jgi:hypothetical protein